MPKTLCKTYGCNGRRWIAACVRDAPVFLATTTVRRVLNLTQSARSRRETYIGEWLPEPVDTSAEQFRVHLGDHSSGLRATNERSHEEINYEARKVNYEDRVCPTCLTAE